MSELDEQDTIKEWFKRDNSHYGLQCQIWFKLGQILFLKNVAPFWIFFLGADQMIVVHFINSNKLPQK